MSNQTVDLLDADEQEVKEVRCSVTGIPISTIPNWYAQVNVNFVSDHARSKSSAAAAQANYLRLAELSDKEDEEEAEESDEISLDDMDENITAADIDIEDMDIGGDDSDDADTDS
ncbi:hypothetical protein [Armatimonas sp.]|uniref:hypothetical protein n=1 Tax=Armatimonas sp. TaxID=1872638 RepID=UPI00286A9E82|nr:hypothetical protein [Armatimonas sp.]